MSFEYFIDENLLNIKSIHDNLKNNKIVERIWEKDHTVWNNNPNEISNRLGWLDCPESTFNTFKEINQFADQIKSEGFTHALLMGMGGSSLAPEVFRLTFGVKKGFLDLHVIDSTHPEAVLEKAHSLDPKRTLYIVSTKSGGTVETMSFMKYFYQYVQSKVGKEKVSKHFIAITDPGSGLEETAKRLNFRKIFLNDPNIGGRFSALSLFGLVPAALVGVDLNQLTQPVLKSKKIFQQSNEQNSAALFGLIMGSLAELGIDKLTLIISKSLASFGSWAEQLIAESTGKSGKGILPIDLEAVRVSTEYSEDRYFVYLKLKGEIDYDLKIREIKTAGFPIIILAIDDLYEIGSEFLRWELATVIAGWMLKIQPFDQPNVESAKVLAREVLKEYAETGKLKEPDVSLKDGEIIIYGSTRTENLPELLKQFFSDLISGKSYLSIQAYLKPDENIWNELQKLRSSIQLKYKIATTLGYGPRFLHSTGQLHKGDAGNGLFIQFTSDVNKVAQIPDDAEKPDSSISFNVLIKAQMFGDRQALINNNRKVISINLGENGIKSLNRIINMI